MSDVSALRESARDSVTRRLVGESDATPGEEANGYIFWGLLTLFIGVPELLAGIKWLRERVNPPWPTISNLVGKDLESHHHPVALVVLGLIAFVVVYTVTLPPDQKTLGRATREPVGPTDPWVGLAYIAFTGAAGITAGGVAELLNASNNHLGYAIYGTLAVLGIVIPTALAPFRKVLAVPSLIATLALLRSHRHLHWLAAFVTALLFVLIFHLALYPWPNYHFGMP